MKYLIYSLTILLALSCKVKNKQSDSGETASKNETKDVEKRGNKTNVADTLKSFTVSFFSPGSGIDRKIKTEYDAYLLKLEEGNPILKGRQIKKWGREGEVNYCFDLKEVELSKKQTFIKESKDILSKSDRVNLIYNKGC
ncbi:MAG: hypothetical protein IPM51_07095 [Sphingobacteriaceae bacterium]|nr:hypothetical protein [Sphingobacteriaceae bacterium]